MPIGFRNDVRRQAAARGLSVFGSLVIGVMLMIVYGWSIGSAHARLKPAPQVAPVPEEVREVEEEPHPAHQAIRANPIHDPSNPDFPRLQTMQEATRHLPKDANGFPDWMRALRSGAIEPRAGLRGDEKMLEFDLDVIMRNTKEMPHVRFPHKAHSLWLDCSNCHPSPFLPQRGANQIQMADIFRGRFCGVCHDRVAFITFFSCYRCHSVGAAAAAK